jgi:putative transposase
VCANLGIRLLHAKPYHAWSKGKVERVFLTLQQGFESMLRLPGMGVGSLRELNEKLWRWIEEIYHGRVHSSTGLKPSERFVAGLQGAAVRKLEPALDLESLFYARATRTVRKDGTVRLEGVLYEVDLSLRGFTIELRFDPYKLDRLEIYHRGKPQGLARRVDLHLNSQLGGSRYYDR